MASNSTAESPLRVGDITKEEFIRYVGKEVEVQKQRLLNALTERLAEKLKKNLGWDNQDESDQMYLKQAREYLNDPAFKGIKVHGGHLVNEEELREVCRLVDMYQNKQEHAFLFINAPLEDHHFTKEGKQKYSVEEDLAMRQKEIDHFKEWFPFSEQGKVVDVYNQTDVNAAINDFARNEGRNAIMLWLFINGEGTEEGLLLNNDAPLPLDFIIHWVKVQNVDRSYGMDPPLPSQIVFAQCFGHAFNMELVSNFKDRYSVYVFSLSCPEMKLTFSKVGRWHDAKDREHHLLQNMAGNLYDMFARVSEQTIREPQTEMSMTDSESL